MSSKRKSQPTRIFEEQPTEANIMFPSFPAAASFKSTNNAADSESEIERLKILQQECLQSLILQQQQQQLQQSLSQQLNKFTSSASEMPYTMSQQQQGAGQQKSMQDTLKCLKSLQLARSLENDKQRYSKNYIFLSILGSNF